MPHYDAGLNIIFTVAKGESTIRYYEIHNNHILYLNEHRELTSGKSFESILQVRRKALHSWKVIKCKKMRNTYIPHSFVCSNKEQKNLRVGKNKQKLILDAHKKDS